VAVVRRPLAIALALTAAVAATLGVAACGGGGDHKNTSAVQAVDANCDPVKYSGSGTPQKLIVSDLPLQGDSAERSKQMNEAIIQEIARKGWQAGPSIQIAFQACDDSIASTGEWDENTCRTNAQAYAADPDVIGVIGTYNSGCAAIEMPILNRAPGGGIPMVSPGNTLVCLTESSPTLCKPNEPAAYFPSGKRNYVRVVPNDAVQGAGMASFALQQGIRKPFILIASDDPTSEGQGRTFEGAAKALGMKIAGVEHFDPKASSYTDLMKKAQAAGADAVFLGAILEENGAQLIKDKVAVLGPNTGNVKLLLPDGFTTQSTIDEAGAKNAEGLYASVAGVPPDQLKGAGATFVSTFDSTYHPDALDPYTPYAAAAAQVLLNAIAASDGSRADIAKHLFGVQVTNSVLGNFAIDQNGDTNQGSMTIDVAKGGKLVTYNVLTPPSNLVETFH
jgi:branched-chain amino acid transport system substrate-binding protein